jgi:hypothetical protein
MPVRIESFSNIPIAPAKSTTLGELIQGYGKALRLLAEKEKSIDAIFANALMDAGHMWIEVFLPKRFEYGYAHNVVGYRTGMKYETFKDHNAGHTDKSGRTIDVDQPRPFVYTGKSKATVEGSAYPVVQGDSSHMSLRIRMRLGDIARKKADVFTRVPDIEYFRVVAHVERIMRRQVMPMLEKNALPDSYRTHTNPRSFAQSQQRNERTAQARSA